MSQQMFDAVHCYIADSQLGEQEENSAGMKAASDWSKVILNVWSVQNK